MPETYPNTNWKPKQVQRIYEDHNKSLPCYCMGCRLYRFEIKEKPPEKK